MSKKKKITYKEEPVTFKLLEEAQPLFEDTAKETGQLTGPLDVNKLAYIKMYSMGMYAPYVARNAKGEMVGYLGFVVTPHLYFQDHVIAQQDVLHLSKDYRKGFIGIKLIKFSEEKLKERGATMILQHSTNNKDISNLFLRLGYAESDRIFTKEI